MAGSPELTGSTLSRTSTSATWQITPFQLTIDESYTCVEVERMQVTLLCAILLPLLVLVTCHAQNVNFSITNFTGSRILLNGDCSVAGGPYLRLLVNDTDTGGDATTGLTSRAVYDSRVQLFDPATGNAASFNTMFTFRMTPVPFPGKEPYVYIPGDGMTFIIAPFYTIPVNVSGSSLGLLDTKYPRKDPRNQVVAVEFDTYYNEGVDPVNSSNHVGLDINDYASVKTQNLSVYGITLNGYSYDDPQVSAWIDYDAGGQLLLVYMAIAPSTKAKASLVLSYTNFTLSDYVQAYSYVGFTATTGRAVQNTYIYSWSFSTHGLSETVPLGVPGPVPVPEPVEPNPLPPPPLPSRTSRNSGDVGGVIAGVASGVALLVVAIVGVCSFCYCKSRRSSRKNGVDQVEADPKEAGASSAAWEDGDVNYGPRLFSYWELKVATVGFSPSHVLGQGGFGKVYRGVIRSGDSRSETQLAIKKISQDSTQGEREFRAELSSLGRLRHKNLVRLQGWCQEQDELLLVYEYMPNSSLDRHLYSRDGKGVLSWTHRYQILQGVAAALVYIHTEWDKCVLHRDIKPSNVMLDSQMNGRLGDFGLARLLDTVSTGMSLTGIAGTAGYMAPEFILDGKATAKSDVFSFGILLLEVACGRKPQFSVLENQDIHLLDWVWLMHEADNLLAVADPALDRKFDATELRSVLHLGLLCTHPGLNFRPPTKRVQQMLNGDVQLPPLPRCRPVAQYGVPMFPSPEMSY